MLNAVNATQQVFFIFYMNNCIIESVVKISHQLLFLFLKNCKKYIGDVISVLKCMVRLDGSSVAHNSDSKSSSTFAQFHRYL